MVDQLATAVRMPVEPSQRDLMARQSAVQGTACVLQWMACSSLAAQAREKAVAETDGATVGRLQTRR
eukprot:12231870-Alexandrium_andersonii.AAC.1